MIMKFLVSLHIVWSVVCLFAAAETGCPDEEDIAPCTCTRRPTTRLVCEGLSFMGDIENAFANSERYTYQEVHIVNSTLPYIPGDVFQKVTIKELYLRNVYLSKLFSEVSVENKDLYKLQIENGLVIRSIPAQNLTSFTGLKEFSIYNASVSVISRHFSDILPKNIKRIVLYGTKTRRISAGALMEVPNLYSIAVESCNLKTLTRDIFPRPFNGRILFFNHNQISTIPDDLFTDMPNLQIISMTHNAITVIPGEAFAGRSVNVPYLRFTGNPLQCDCQLLWLIKDKPEFLEGTCASPENFEGRELQTLEPAEFRC